MSFKERTNKNSTSTIYEGRTVRGPTVNYHRRAGYDHGVSEERQRVVKMLIKDLSPFERAHLIKWIESL